MNVKSKRHRTNNEPAQKGDDSSQYHGGATPQASHQRYAEDAADQRPYAVDKDK